MLGFELCAIYFFTVFLKNKWWLSFYDISDSWKVCCLEEMFGDSVFQIEVLSETVHFHAKYGSIQNLSSHSNSNKTQKPSYVRTTAICTEIR